MGLKFANSLSVILDPFPPFVIQAIILSQGFTRARLPTPKPTQLFPYFMKKHCFIPKFLFFLKFFLAHYQLLIPKKLNIFFFHLWNFPFSPSMYQTNLFTMDFKAEKFYYIHNFGIDFQKIFFSEEHKTYFTKKIYKYIAPYADIISFKLADNQFHILIKTKEDYEGQLLNFNIGVMLRSYTRAINKQRKRVGSLFCSGTKAFSRISDIPNRLRTFITPFLHYFKEGYKVNFGKSIQQFINFLTKDKALKTTSTFTKYKLSFEEIFDHPLKKEKSDGDDPT